MVAFENHSYGICSRDRILTNLDIGNSSTLNSMTFGRNIDLISTNLIAFNTITNREMRRTHTHTYIRKIDKRYWLVTTFIHITKWLFPFCGVSQWHFTSSFPILWIVTCLFDPLSFPMISYECTE